MKTISCAGICGNALLAVLCATSAGHAAVYNTINNPFDIQVLFDENNDGIADDGGLTATQRAIFGAAESFWETMILGNRYDIAIGPLVISARGVFIDGVNGTLGSAGWSTGVVTTGGAPDYAYAQTGLMRFDTADLDALEASNTLFDVIVHEMAHVIGFGTMWTVGAVNSIATISDPYVTGTGEYTGFFANALYELEFGVTDGFIPVELDGGPGTANGHWDENDFAGGSRDIMTGFLNNVSPSADAPFAASTLSATTIASFADIGYITVATDIVAPVPLPATLSLGLLGLAGLGAVSRRRKAA